MPDEFFMYWTTRFPLFVCKLWAHFENIKHETRISGYYKAFHPSFSPLIALPEISVAGHADSQDSDMSHVNKLVEECIKMYEVRMRASLERLQTEDHFHSQHEYIKAAALQYFTEYCKSTNTQLVNECINQIKDTVDQVFQEIEHHFQMIAKYDSVAVKAALSKAKAHYIDNMDKLCGNIQEGFLADMVLQQMHSESCNVVLNSIKDDHNWTLRQQDIVVDHLKKLFLKYKEKNEMIQKMYNDDIAIGIDLYASNCRMAVYHKGTVKFLQNSSGSNTTPSYVTINPDGSTIVGQTAKDNAYKYPEATIFDLKDIIGGQFDDEKIQYGIKRWPFIVQDAGGKARIKIHDKEYYPDELVSTILKHLRKEAEENLKVKVNKAVITVPSYFSDGQIQDTLFAGKIAGLDILGILKEPTAAALAYHHLDCKLGTKDRTVLVYDLGRKTFDVTILQISDLDIDVISVNGDPNLGGEDFDKNLVTHCVNEFREMTGIDILKAATFISKTEREDTSRRIQRLQSYCEVAKKQLSFERHASGSINVCVDGIVKDYDISVNVTKQKFESMNAQLFQKTITIVEETIKSAGLQKKEIDDIVLVGGSTKIPMIQEMLIKYFDGKPLNKTINPDEAVAYGAAIQAAILNLKK